MTTVAPIRVFVDTFMENQSLQNFSNQDILGLIETDIPDIMDRVSSNGYLLGAMEVNIR